MTKVIVNGTFDILHRGHLELLDYAKSCGGHLVVAIDTDRRVKELKGESRPINNQYDRKYHLEMLKPVDQVVLFDSKEELIQIIEDFKPDIMVKGSDYKGRSVVGATYVPEVIYYERIGAYSTTKTIQDIISRG
jgi:D-beta-D-heptose 7-phosphate kinase/D-beta-D-heptose 1-phosphate adenosyltransferase